MAKKKAKKKAVKKGSEGPWVVCFTTRRGVFIGRLAKSKRLGTTDTFAVELVDVRMLLHVETGGFVGLAESIPKGTRVTHRTPRHVDTAHGWTECSAAGAEAWEALA
jgi:hypothetical protein